MKKKMISNSITGITLFAVFTISLSSCYFNEGAFTNKNNCITPTGATVSRTFDTEDFSTVYVPDEWAELTIEKGDHCQVVFEGKEDLLDGIELSTKDDALQFNLNKCINGFEKVKVRMTMKSLQKLSNSTFNAPVHVRGFSGTSLNITNDENAVMDFDVDYKRITCQMNRGTLKLTGKADDMDGYFYTSAKLEGFGLEAQRVNIVSNSIFEIQTKAIEKLVVKINDSGNVHYKGYPVIESTITGTGKLIDSN